MADPQSVMNEVRELILRLTNQKGRQLEPFDLPLRDKKRRLQFEPTYGPATGKVEPKPPPMRYIPGTLDFLARSQGIASDDPFQLAAKLEAWKRHRR